MPKGFPSDRMQNLPPPYVSLPGVVPGGKGPPRGPVDWDGAMNAVLDEFKVPTVPAGGPQQPMRGVRILSPDLLQPGMGRPDGCPPNCTLSQEFGVPFSRVAFYVSNLRTTASNTVQPPVVDFEIYGSIGCVRTLIFRGTFAPQIPVGEDYGQYGDLLVQVSGLLMTEVEVYMKIDLGRAENAGAVPYWITLMVALDRQNADRQTWLGPDVT